MENIQNNPITLDIEGKTVEDAIEKALAKLNVARSQISVKVLSEEKKGLFGMGGAKLAKIRVTVKKA
ncbi:MAG: Jag N-terminal domain-containing protein [Candidatus Omnitrophota bacterium]